MPPGHHAAPTPQGLPPGMDMHAAAGLLRRAAWMEVAMHPCGGAAEGGDAAEFMLVFVVLMPAQRSLVAYADEEQAQLYASLEAARHAPKARPLAEVHLGPKGRAAGPLPDPPYNYEHAFLVSAADGSADWWLCPDTPADSAEWVAALNNA